MIRNRTAALVAALLSSFGLAAQQDQGAETTPDRRRPPVKASPQEPAAPQGEPRELPPITITALRRVQDPFEIPRSVIVVDREQLARRDQNSVLDALDRRIGIWIEKRTATTSDPVLRGLSGANLLALVDGDPLTTFWGEGGFAGDDMYGKVDAESIERVEVIRGPGSVQYGANALGGVIHFITRKPSLEMPDEGLRVGGRVRASFDTVNLGRMTRFDGEAAVPSFRMRVGGTYRETEDGHGGSGVGTLAPSGGEEHDFDASAEWALDAQGQALTFSMQQVARRGLARFYRPTQRNDNDRTGLSVGYRSAAPDAGTGVTGRVYYQWKEDRRRFRTSGNLGVAQWQTWSSDWTARTDQLLEGHALMAGATLRLDEGQSPDDEQFTIYEPNGTRTKAAPDQDWWNLGLFVLDEWDITEWLQLSAGLRYDRFLYESKPDTFYQPPVGDPALDQLHDWQHSVTGGIGAVARLAEEWRLAGSWSRGFRSFAPRFGISKTGFGVLVPSGLLDPVTADNYELALRHRSARVVTELVGYYTHFDGFQSITPGSFQGSDFYDYDANSVFDPDERVYVTRGDGRAIVYGVEWAARVNLWRWLDALPEGLYADGGFMWNYGRDLANQEPFRHTHPARGIVALGYEEPVAERFYVELSADIVRAYTRIPSSRLASDVGYRSDPQDSSSPLLRSDGLPGYTVYDLEAGYRANDHLRFGVKAENLTDKNYRGAHSRMDAFGINLGVWMEASF